MNSDEKIERIERIINNEEFPPITIGPAITIVGPVHYGPQSIGFTKNGKQHLDELFNAGNLPNPLKDCTVIVKIENSKAQVSVVHEGVTVFEFKPVDPKFTTSIFELTGVSLPLTIGW